MEKLQLLWHSNLSNGNSERSTNANQNVLVYESPGQTISLETIPSLIVEPINPYPSNLEASAVVFKTEDNNFYLLRDKRWLYDLEAYIDCRPYRRKHVRIDSAKPWVIGKGYSFYGYHNFYPVADVAPLAAVVIVTSQELLLHSEVPLVMQEYYAIISYLRQRAVTARQWREATVPFLET